MEEKEIKLPFQKPFTVTFAPYANAVSILLNYPAAYPWLMNCFIQLTCWGNQYLDYYDFNYRTCPILSLQRIRKGMVVQYSEITRFIADALEKGYYVFLPVNTRYIHEYDFENYHELMVYGHRDAQLFYIADNFRKGKYQKGICSAEELIQATKDMENPETWRNGFDGMLELVSYRVQDRATFELYRVLESMKDYLHSEPTKRWYIGYHMWDEAEMTNRCFGMQCYDAIHYSLRIAREIGCFEESGHRALFLESEHKQIMLRRLSWMKDKYPVDDEIIQKYMDISEKARIAMLLKLKYDVRPEQCLLDRIGELYHEIQKEEEIALKRMVRLV